MLQENMDEVKEHRLLATNPDNHKLEQELATEGQEYMEIDEGITKDKDENIEFTKVSIIFLCH